MKKKILRYGLGWNPNTKQGAITLDVGDAQPMRVPVSSAEEFAALAAVLNEEPVFLDTTNGFIVTGWEPPGGA
jgi:hypothetical protein